MKFLFPLLLVLLYVTAAWAQETVFQLDPAQSRVEFTLPATFHTVHGTFQLRSGTIRFNLSTGEASGRLVADSTSGRSGNDGRDRRMHRQILEDQKYPEIVFTPEHVSGKLAAEGNSEMQVQGQMTLHGQPHPLAITVPVRVDHDQVSADAHFMIPYLQWGLKNPSTFVLRVSDKVTLDVHAVGRLSRAPAGAPRGSSGW